MNGTSIGSARGMTHGYAVLCTAFAAALLGCQSAAISPRDDRISKVLELLTKQQLTRGDVQKLLGRPDAVDPMGTLLYRGRDGAYLFTVVTTVDQSTPMDSAPRSFTRMNDIPITAVLYGGSRFCSWGADESLVYVFPAALQGMNVGASAFGGVGWTPTSVPTNAP